MAFNKEQEQQPDHHKCRNPHQHPRKIGITCGIETGLQGRCKGFMRKSFLTQRMEG
jgi:hypothetical protein